MAELKIPKPPTFKKPALWKLVLIFVAVFVVVLLLFNLPALIGDIQYFFTHSTDSDNEKLTEQYRALYGYASHPELNPLSGSPHVLPTSGPRATSTPDLQTSAAVSNQVGTLSIAKLNLSVPVLRVPSGTDADILTSLKNGVVQFPGSGDPGQSGMTVIIGHSSSTFPWTKYSAIFSQLGKLQKDDLINVKFGSQDYVYRVSDIQKALPNRSSILVFREILLLSTCWPVGTDTNRVAVAAMRVK